MVWDCDAKNCDYSTDDRRNLHAHKRKHSKVHSFQCKLCTKYFKYFMQLKQHRMKPECKAKRKINKYLHGIKCDNMNTVILSLCQ